ncbi:hypothetical protein ABB37_09184 [Leptomonas pyrrhocoris]|uniref:Transmembrane protein n=1 Tax=Leptomonas pyrrhocoris TaxID=157538 RepID=A0A0M9FRF1_LEPPY|nr:hypothetical protein ABB37_09184 [Leptomonas pyrrhocoris]XP_015652970.1 hypothetical protein ABB37_09184 [Leptomonas pyrrhocoris]KPA74530.1 hypothetical protein ABB37_09184 [Leptomonas pyrrhocoris]KPA74531.1 hypothetical protein ABB37_09184 [Leptomonas pyrrhocoris]|eukprot:XP_015652969.1 hypothetical protein ABB37_09184 [Leptomonas pyrrhocoris]
MTDGLPTALCFLELIVFFCCDFFYAKKLNEQKNAHPELDDCAPNESPDLDTIAVLDSLTATAVDLYQHERERFTGVPAPANARDYAFIDEHGPSAATAAAMNRSDAADNVGSNNIVHAVVVVCGVVAPVLTLLLVLLPSVFGWTRLHVPSVLSYLAAVPGLAAAGLYAMRAYDLTQVFDVTKTEWMAMMWFRLDFMFIMAAVALLGLGAWAITGCMLAVAMYLAHRVMKMEKQLNRVQRHTQLVRGEVDVERVLVPGSAESKKAAGINEGYSALA